MKKVLFALALLGAFAPAARAQVVVDGVNINNIPEVQMIRMVAQGRVFSSKLNIFIDYGQDLSGSNRRRMEVINPRNDERVVFNSVMQAVNYLIANGWEYQEAMVLPTEGNASSIGGSTQYIFRRKE